MGKVCVCFVQHCHGAIFSLFDGLGYVKENWSTAISDWYDVHYSAIFPETTFFYYFCYDLSRIFQQRNVVRQLIIRYVTPSQNLVTTIIHILSPTAHAANQFAGRHLATRCWTESFRRNNHRYMSVVCSWADRQKYDRRMSDKTARRENSSGERWEKRAKANRA